MSVDEEKFEKNLDESFEFTLKCWKFTCNAESGSPPSSVRQTFKPSTKSDLDGCADDDHD